MKKIIDPNRQSIEILSTSRAEKLKKAEELLRKEQSKISLQSQAKLQAAFEVKSAVSIKVLKLYLADEDIK